MPEETLTRSRLHLPPVLHAREVSLVAEALCRCSQLFGRHAETCPSRVVIRDRRLSDALEAHDRRLLAAAEDPCSSCGQPLDPDNLCRVNGIGYHLGNCPQPHGTPDAADDLTLLGPLPRISDAWHAALLIECPTCKMPGDGSSCVSDGDGQRNHLARIEAATP
jgi:hypothetical protein